MDDDYYDTGDWDGDAGHDWHGWPEPAATPGAATVGTAAGTVRVLAASASYRPAAVAP